MCSLEDDAAAGLDGGPVEDLCVFLGGAFRRGGRVFGLAVSTCASGSATWALVEALVSRFLVAVLQVAAFRVATCAA